MIISHYFFQSFLAVSTLTQASALNFNKVDLPLSVWSSIANSEEVTIARRGLSSGLVECGLACHQNSKCGGFLYDKDTGSCEMKMVIITIIIIMYIDKAFK